MINSDKDFSFTYDGFEGLRAKHFNIDGSLAEHVTVWVEAHDDKRFWMAFLKSDEKYKFSMKAPDEIIASDGKTATGCGRLFSLEKQGDITLAKHNIFCLDSDDSFVKALIPGYSSQKIARDHLFVTNIYAIENATLDLSHLNETFVSTTGLPLESLTTTPSDFIESLSNCIYEVYKDAYFFEAITKDSEKSAKLRKSLFDEIKNLSTLAHGVKIENSKELALLKKSLKATHTEIENEISKLNKQNEKTQFTTDLKTLGITPQNFFLFVNGHKLFDLVCEVFQIYSEILRDKEVERIKKAHKKSKSVVSGLINGWPVFSETLKFGFLAKNPQVPFLSDTLNRLEIEYSRT